MSLAVFSLAFVTGALHAAGVARTARRERGSLGVLGRVILSGAVLALSTRTHHLGTGALGWAAGWLLNGAREYARLS